MASPIKSEPDPITALSTAFTPKSTPFQKIPSTIPTLRLHLLHVQGERTRDPNGIYLLQAYKTTEPQALIQKQDRAVNGSLSPFRTLMPRLIDWRSAGDWLGLLCEAGDGVNRLRPFAELIRGQNVPVLRSTIETMTQELRKLNPARDLQRGDWLSGFDWLRRVTPFASSTRAETVIQIGGKPWRNPIAYAMNNELWRNTPPLTAVRGIVHGALDVAHLYLIDRTPLLIDVRNYNEDMPVLLDWATLELSILLEFMPHDNAGVWNDWVRLCNSLSTNLIADHAPAGVFAAAGYDLVQPLRRGVQTYMEESPATLRDYLEVDFWLSATAAGLKYFSDPQQPENHRKAALIYATTAFDQAASLAHLRQPGDAELISIDMAMASPALLNIPKPDKTNRHFPHGYALIIGVSEQADQQINSLPVARKDAEAIAGFFQTAVGYEPAHLRVLAGAEATLENIRSGFTWLAQTITADSLATAVVYYSGHGGPKGGPPFYLIPADTDLNQLSNTAFSIDELEKALRALPTRRLVVFLDCCHAGSAELKGLEGEFIPKAIDPALLEGSGRVLMASSTAAQVSWILSGHENSLFTEVLLEILAMPGEVDALDVAKYLRDEVKARAASIGCEQTPAFSAKQIVDKITLATND